MSLETLKAFGAWLSNMAYWTLEPIFGGSADDSEGGARTAAGMDHAEPNVSEAIDGQLTDTYASEVEAIACGGAGIAIGGGAYV